jgi:hypothetical protein
MPSSRGIVALIVAVALAAGGSNALATSSTTATRVPAWAPASTATIHPGVQTRTSVGQCTANFVFYDATSIYLGQAAHCASTDGATAVDGCRARTLKLGRPVTITGADHAGTLVYSSWRTMQAAGERDADRCLYNDFALIRLHPEDHAKVNPTVPHWGGPVGLSAPTDRVRSEKVYSYGNSSLRLGVAALSPKEGYRIASASSGWSHTVYTATPGVPGDSGSAFLDGRGKALGVLSTVEVFPRSASNGVADLRLALDYLARHTTMRVRLASGTEPFTPGLLPRRT